MYHARLLYLPLSPRVCSNLCPLSCITPLSTRPTYDWWLGTNSALSHLHITSDMMLSSDSDPLLKTSLNIQFP